MKSEIFTQNFSLRLAARRARLGLTQEDLAKKASVSLRSVQNWEGGGSLPSGKKLRLLCAALDVDMGYFYEGENVLKTEIGAVGDIARRCKDYLNQFIRNCHANPDKLSWTLVELQAHFPLDKWRYYSGDLSNQEPHDQHFNSEQVFDAAKASMGDAEVAAGLDPESLRKSEVAEPTSHKPEQGGGVEKSLTKKPGVQGQAPIEHE